MHIHQNTGDRPTVTPRIAPDTFLSAAANSPLHTSIRSRWAGSLAAAWGLAGTMLLLLSAIVHLLTISFNTLAHGLLPIHWITLAGSVVIIASIEGCTALQRHWVQRVIERTTYLHWHWTPARLVLAPLYCMSLFHATAQRLLVAWAGITSMAVLIVVLYQLAQPWSGVIATGVLALLAWGLAALLLQSLALLLMRFR